MREHRSPRSRARGLLSTLLLAFACAAFNASALEPIPDKLVVLTFDDANKSDRSFVAEVLKKHGFGATFYVTEGLGFLKSKAHYTTWAEIRELHDMGFEIGNHTQHHRNVARLDADSLSASLAHIDQRCQEHGIPQPVTFCYPGFSHGPSSLPVIDKHGFLFARRGIRPEYQDGGEGGRGPVYDPEADHPLLIPTTWYAGPKSGTEDFQWAANRGRDGKIAVLCYHGVPALEHPWVNTSQEAFLEQMQWLKDENFKVIAMRDLARHVDPTRRPANTYADIRERTPISIGSRRELFADTHLIDSMQGDLQQHLHQPRPEEVVLTTDRPWEGNTCAYYTLFQDGHRYRMYYRGSHYDESTKRAGHREVTCYAESHDGIHWQKPNLGLYEFDGSKENNIVWDGIGTHCFTVFKDANPNCPPEARYKAISRGHPKAAKGLYVFQSPDGIHWSMLQEAPVITEGAFDSQNLAFWDGQAQVYRTFFRTFVNGVRAILTSESNDYLEWSDPVLLSYGDAPAQHLYTNAILPYPRAPHLLIGFPTRYLPKENDRVEPTFMMSRDRGRTFHRWLAPVIPESAPHDRGGNRSNYMAWGLLNLPTEPDRYSVYATEAYYTGPDSRLRRFSYRKDGFVSIRAGAKGGTLLTKPLALAGDRLTVNFRPSSPEGQMRIELQDELGQAIKGFTLDDGEPIAENGIDLPVRWSGDATALAQLAGSPVRLRIEMSDGDLYAFQFSPRE